ncbi:MAG: hypothetical protein AMXMBFR64_54580 [Myxococcales bacterium]
MVAKVFITFLRVTAPGHGSGAGRPAHRARLVRPRMGRRGGRAPDRAAEGGYK